MTKRIKPKKRQSPVKAIREHCLECVGHSYNLVENCASPDCALFEFRFGKNPYNSRTKLTDKVVSRVQCIS
jgi:hypothetical protein